MDIGNGEFWRGDCLELMADIPDGSVDMILCDLPYGTTACKWDTVIPFEPLWKHYRRISKPNAAIVLTAAQPFTSALVMSNIRGFRHEWVWDKVNKYTGSLQANRRRLRRHEDVLVFSESPLITYNKQWRVGRPFVARQTKGHGDYSDNRKPHVTINDGRHNPCSVLEIAGDNKTEAGHHPTQKPVALMEYLIRTYTNPGETVLDNCAGSGTTAIAAERTGRRWICIEKDKDYYEKACERVKDEIHRLI